MEGVSVQGISFSCSGVVSLIILGTMLAMLEDSQKRSAKESQWAAVAAPYEIVFIAYLKPVKSLIIWILNKPNGRPPPPRQPKWCDIIVFIGQKFCFSLASSLCAVCVLRLNRITWRTVLGFILVCCHENEMESLVHTFIYFAALGCCSSVCLRRLDAVQTNWT